jgi:hypothetical protein
MPQSHIGLQEVLQARDVGHEEEEEVKDSHDSHQKHQQTHALAEFSQLHVLHFRASHILRAVK